MKERSITPVRDLRYNELYLDFLAKKPAMKKYFFAGDPLNVAIRLGRDHVERGKIADILVRQNTAFGAQPGTFKAIEKLRHEDTLAVFGGQQAVLFGGNLLILYKALAAIKEAKILEEKLKRNVVPIFWIAADDHDFDEINQAFVLNQKGEPAGLSYDHKPAAAVPASDILFDNEEAYKSLVQKTEMLLGETDFTGELYHRLFDAYRPGNSYVNAFGQYLLNILPDIGLIAFSPADKEIKEVSKSFFKKLVEGHFRLKENLKETSESLLKDGYHLQVEKKPTAVHFFYSAPARTPIHFEDDTFIVGEKRLGLNALLDLIDRNPFRFSPDVLTRPLWQSYLFPVVTQIGGPAEIAYFAQIGKLFDDFGLIQPHHIHRPSLTIIEKRQEELMENLELRLTDFTGDVEDLINRVTARSFPKEMETAISDFRAKFEEAFNHLFALARNFDEGLEPMGKQTYGKIDFAINSFEKKIYDHHKKKMLSTRNQIYRLANSLFPQKDLQERVINVNYYIAKYGFGIVDFVAQNLEVESVDHQLLYISGMSE